MARSTIYLLSDLHLAPTAAEDGVWRRYLTPRFIPDERVAALFAAIAEAGDAEVVLAGDTFDLDLVSGADAEPGRGWLSRWSGADRSAAAAVRRLHAALDAHPVFARALGRLLAARVPVTVLVGNHDAELAWPEVQEALASRLDAAAGRSVRAGLLVEPWFLHRPGLLYVEHGHQHDPFTRPVDVRAALTAGDARARLPFASICQRALTNHIPTLNSTVEKSYILDTWAYVAHWWRYYAFSRRSIFFPWLIGALAATANVVRQEWRLPGPPPPGAIDAYAAARSLPPGVGGALSALWPAPAIRQPLAVLRELWLDRLIVAVAAVLAAAVLLGSGAPAWLAAGGPALFLWLAIRALTMWKGGSPVQAYEAALPAAAEQIGAKVGVPFVVLGHTHGARLVPFARARGPRGAYLNAGAWAPGFLDPECTRPAFDRFTFVEIDAVRGEARLCRQDEGGRVVVGVAAGEDRRAATAAA